VLALNAPVTEYNKRILLSAKTFTWLEIGDLIRARRPELAYRLPASDLEPPYQSKCDMDTQLAEALLGLKEYVNWEETILESLKIGLQVEE